MLSNRSWPRRLGVGGLLARVNREAGRIWRWSPAPRPDAVGAAAAGGTTATLTPLAPGGRGNGHGPGRPGHIGNAVLQNDGCRLQPGTEKG